jgi:hypothetical protein
MEWDLFWKPTYEFQSASYSITESTVALLGRTNDSCPGVAEDTAYHANEDDLFAADTIGEKSIWKCQKDT